MPELIYDPLYHTGRVNESLRYGVSPITREWDCRIPIRATPLLCPNDLDPWNEVRPFSWLDKIAVMVWVLKKITETEDLPFVLHYWDLPQHNVIIDSEEKLK